MLRSSLNALKTKTLNRSLFTLFLALLLVGCNTDPDFLGGDILPIDDDLTVATDTTFQLSAYTYSTDSLMGGSLTSAVLGSVYDSVFGRTQSSVITQVGVASLSHDFGTVQQIDSAFLILSLQDYYGDRSKPINVSVYELNDSLIIGSRYNSLDSYDHLYSTDQPIGTTEYQGETVLKVPLDLDWAYKFSTFDTSAFSSQNNFLQHFYGVYITTSELDEYGKAMYYFDLIDDDGAIDIYYTNDNDDERIFSMLLNNLFVREVDGVGRGTRGFNIIKHDLDAADDNFRINNLNNDTQDSVVYVQGLGGVRTKLMLDDIAKWLERMPVAINRAELRIELNNDPLITNEFYMPPRLHAFYFNADGDEMSVPDYNSDSQSDRLDGRYYKARGHYSMNITVMLQKILSGEIDANEIFIEPTAYQKANHAVLRSPTHSKPMKLIITYTKL